MAYGYKINGQSMAQAVTAPDDPTAITIVQTDVTAMHNLHAVIGLAVTYSVQVLNGANAVSLFQWPCVARTVATAAMVH